MGDTIGLCWGGGGPPKSTPKSKVFRSVFRYLKIIARMSAVQVFRIEVVVTAVLINLSCCLLVFVVKQFLTRMRGTKITALNIRRITS